MGRVLRVFLSAVGALALAVVGNFATDALKEQQKQGHDITWLGRLVVSEPIQSWLVVGSVFAAFVWAIWPSVAEFRRRKPPLPAPVAASAGSGTEETLLQFTLQRLTDTEAALREANEKLQGPPWNALMARATSEAALSGEVETLREQLRGYEKQRNGLLAEIAELRKRPNPASIKFRWRQIRSRWLEFIEDRDSEQPSASDDQAMSHWKAKTATRYLANFAIAVTDIRNELLLRGLTDPRSDCQIKALVYPKHMRSVMQGLDSLIERVPDNEQ